MRVQVDGSVDQSMEKRLQKLVAHGLEISRPTTLIVIPFIFCPCFRIGTVESTLA